MSFAAMTSGNVALAKDIAKQHGLDPALVCAMVEQESAWDTFAIRCESESGFMQRYGQAYAQLVKRTASKHDDKWLRFEDIFYTSYGLMQTMYPVVIEMLPDLNPHLQFPTQLCDPPRGLDAGCRIFRKKLDGADGDVALALLRWNGGGNPNYPHEVLARVARYR